MKSFNDFINEPIAVFCNSGGPEDQYKKGIHKGNIPVFCNSGGPPEQKESIDENLNPRNNPIVHKTNSDILYDPEKENKGLGDERYHPKFLISNGSFEPDYVEPHFNTEQAKHIQALSDNTDDDDKYHDIVSKYTWNSYKLNSELFDRHNKRKPVPEYLHANDDDEHPINISDFDNLIDSHRLPHEMTVYSGLHFHPNEHRGRIYIHPSYLSTSVSPHVSKEFGKTLEMYDSENGTSRSIRNILRLHLPKGHPHLFTDKGSNYPGQGEIILPRNTRFQMGQRPTHIIRGNFLNHFGNGRRATHNEFHIYTGRILNARI